MKKKSTVALHFSGKKNDNMQNVFLHTSKTPRERIFASAKCPFAVFCIPVHGKTATYASCASTLVFMDESIIYNV
jgi:hypothetical protein